MELRNELKRFLESLDGDELRNLADGNLREDMVVDEYLASLSSDAKDEGGSRLVDLTCQVCGKNYRDDEPKMCCSGKDCGCLGLPTEPLVCSKECWDKLQPNTPKDEGEETVYDQLSELHDKICDEMEKITLEQIDTDGFFLGRYRAYRHVIKMIKKYDVVATPPPSLSAKEWYANRTNRKVDEFDYYDLHLCRAAEDYARTVGEKPKEDLTVADELEKDNPYPETVFLPMSETEITEVAEYLKKGGYSIDCLAGNTMRRSWNLCVGRLRELIKER